MNKLVQPDDLSDIWIVFGDHLYHLYFQIQVTEKYSTAMCYEGNGLDFII